MTPQATYVITAAVVVSALAMILQAVLLYGLYRSSKATRDHVALIAVRSESLVETAQKALEQSRKQIGEVTSKAAEILDVTRVQLARVDEILTDATSRAKVQMDRVEMVLDDTISRVHETTAMLHNGILRPLKEVNAFSLAIRAAFHALLTGKRPTVAQATQDDEMFI